MSKHTPVKRITTIAAAVALSALLGAAPAQAQSGVRVGLAGTGLFSLESGGGSRFGGMALVGFGGGHRHPLGLRLDGTFTRGDGVWQEIGTADLTYTFHTPLSIFHPYLLAGGGVAHVPDLTKPLAKFGGGLEYHLVHRNRGAVLFLEPTFNLLFAGDANGGTQKSIQVNLGLKFGD